jgi:hypothetical protein
MKVDKKKFDEAVSYFIEIDNTPIEDLDLSEFGKIGKEIMSDVSAIKEMGFRNSTVIINWESFRIGNGADE